MYVVPNAPIAVFDVTPKDWWNVVSLAIQSYGVIAATIGALATFVAAAVALYIANRDRRERRADEKRQNDGSRQLIGEVLSPELERLLSTLSQIYTEMCRMRNLRKSAHLKKAIELIQWLEARLVTPMLARFLKDLPLLEPQLMQAYAKVYGLMPSLVSAAEQFRICPTSNPWWSVRFGALEYAIGNVSYLISSVLKIPPGDFRVQPVQVALTKYRETLETGRPIDT